MTPPTRGRGGKKGRFRRRRLFSRRKVCPFLEDKNLVKKLDFKNADFLKRFVMPNGRIIPRRISGVSAPYQRKLTVAIKRARMIALLPYRTDD